MATNQEVKQKLRDAIAQDQASDAAVDAAVEEVLALINDDQPTEPVNAVEEAVVDAISTKGLAQTFGEEALVAELEDLGYTVTAPGSDVEEPVDPGVEDTGSDFEDTDSDFDQPVTRNR